MTRSNIAIWTAIAILFLLVFATAATAQPFCGKLPLLLEALRDSHKEFVTLTGKASETMMLLTASDDGSWTILQSNGQSACIIATGDKLENHRGT